MSNKENDLLNEQREENKPMNMKNAGCDLCGVNDRLKGSKFCAHCMPKPLKQKPGDLTLGGLKEAMLMYCKATNPAALKRMTKSVIDQYNAVKEAEAITNENL